MQVDELLGYIISILSIAVAIKTLFLPQGTTINISGDHNKTEIKNNANQGDYIGKKEKHD
ncbi:hypothetical protein ACWY2R_07085 [Enterococcus avium]